MLASSDDIRERELNTTDEVDMATLACTACDDVVDETFWDEELQMCEECAGNSGGAKYHCGMIHDDGEDTCKSCGEPI